MAQEAWVGCKVKKDVINETGLVILARGTVLNREHLELIDKHQLLLTESMLDYPILATSRPNPVEEKLISGATEEIQSIFQNIQQSGKVPVRDIEQSIIPSIHEVSDHPNLHDILSGIQAKDDYTYRHNIGVGVISTMIGKWLGLKGEELQLLTLAATLHDVGKVKIEDDILNKPGKYTDEEYATMKRHTIYGYELLKVSKEIPERAALVALQHHEREDGRGYPYAMKGSQLDYFSKIVGVADVFHAMTSKRVYKDAAPFHKVMKELIGEGFGVLDAKICNVFVHRMMSMSIGGKALLTNGEKATILMVYPDDPIHPLVEIGGKYMDLRQSISIHVERLIE